MVQGQWRYQDQSIFRNDQLAYNTSSKHCDLAAAQAFFDAVKSATVQASDQVVTDGRGSYSRVIRLSLGLLAISCTGA